MNPKTLVIGGLVVLAATLTFTIVEAQGPQGGGRRAPASFAGTAFTYQGQLKQNGALVNASCSFNFGLWDAATSGSQIGVTETVASVAVTSGLFTAQVNDSGQITSTNPFNGDARWLGIAADCGSGLTTLNPRQALNPAPMAFALPGLYTTQNITSPNVIGGWSGNSTSGYGATIGGGGAPALYCGTPCPNRALNNFATVSGGVNNTASGLNATLGGGYNNTVSNTSATISGGSSNTASGTYSAIGGGTGNNATNFWATVSGGQANTASGPGAVVGGGGYDGSLATGNTASGAASTIPGGLGNSATMTYTFAAGRRAKAVNEGSFVWGDSTNADITSNLNDQFIVRANAGVRIIRGTNVFSTTSTALQAENATTYGEAAWLRLGNTSNPVSVISLIKQTAGTGNFLECYNETGLVETAKCHIDSTGAFVGGSDFAESLAAVGAKADYAPGDVLIISAAQPGGVERSSRAYDRAVIGVYSTRPGFLGADKNGMTQVNADEIPVAITGIVPVKVSVENGAIHPGDLLATSSTLGYAMNAGLNPPSGSVIGKAMGTLEDGAGTLLMLVTLR